MLKDIIDSTPELSSLGQDYPAIAAWLNECSLIPNPSPQGQVPKPYTMAELFALITDPADLAIVSQVADLLKAGQAIVQVTGIEFGSTPESVLATLQGQGLSQTASDAIAARMAETIPDPGWAENVPGEARRVALGIEPIVTPEQVQEALN